jgi:hypothetical protein
MAKECIPLQLLDYRLHEIQDFQYYITSSCNLIGVDPVYRQRVRNPPIPIHVLTQRTPS